MKNSVNILGTKYEITISSIQKDPKLKENYGYCDVSTKQIVVSDLADELDDVESLADLDMFRAKVIRHEMVHAFFFESGLHGCSDFGMNEELVDWIAIQVPKMYEAFRQMQVI